jgi:hypothetical protein
MNIVYFSLLQVKNKPSGGVMNGRLFLVLFVLDLVSQFCDVVLVRRTFSSGEPQGVGILEWGGNGEGMEMGR